MGNDSVSGLSEDSANYIRKVAIIGAGGHVGSHITSQLLQTGKHTITAITRPHSTASIADGIRIVRIDYTNDDDAALVAALEGQQALIITMSVTAPRDTVLKLIRAAAKAKVQFILPNWYGHDPTNEQMCKDSLLAQSLDAACNEVKKLGVSSYFLLASGFWYEWSLSGGPDRYGFDFKKHSLVFFDGGETPMNTTTWPQSGRAIARLLSLKITPDGADDHSPTLSQFRNSPVYISSFRITQRDMFESVKRVTGTTDVDWSISHETSEQRWKNSMDEIKKGNLSAFTKMLYSRAWFPNGDADHESSRGLHNDVLGLPVENLDEGTTVAVRMAENDEVPWIMH
ncbi:putative oxidoreductase CipA-like protein [Karstenula rhodostoma CBS 690.94]|uniref:Oxidoreductase CipA-like protein n=1 Tax=Karstenula rhodostoma CBS 690.94 TaxID=1392251 RepID=A0A9P4UHJ8_9PLEO|nr:putative oxidoreductase CipA-like protein [Karstenula rhodostoma CBS 690.94]